MNAATLPVDVREVVAEHLSVDDADELVCESSDLPVAAIEAGWNECVRDLSHLSRAERQSVLQRTAPYRPRVIECDGDHWAIHLYSAVQMLTGQPRVAAAVLDCGNCRLVAVGV